MYRIVEKRQLNPYVTLMEIEAPLVADKAKAGQFIIFRLDAQGERVPLTIADYNRETGTVTLIFQAVGQTTTRLSQLNVGDGLLDFVGPLGNPTHFEQAQNVCVIGGGVGCAIAYPQAKALFREGARVTVISGFRSAEYVMLEEELRQVSQALYITTDDGSYGEQGFVTTKLKALIDAGDRFDLVIAIGPVPMMKSVSQLTRAYGIKTLVSLNPIMIDGTGMCGGCRVTEDGALKFACVDGPDFDGHLVDFDELMLRNTVYREIETHRCRLMGGENHADT